MKKYMKPQIQTGMRKEQDQDQFLDQTGSNTWTKTNTRKRPTSIFKPRFEQELNINWYEDQKQNQGLLN